MKILQGKVAVVAGATRGAGRGIACMLGEAGATVYCTGRSSRSRTVMREGEAAKDQVKALFDRVQAEQGRLDLLVNDVWGGDELTEWGKPMKLESERDRTEKGLHIRDAQDGDRDAIREVTLSAFQEYAAQMPAHWESYRQGVLATLANVTPAEQIVAEREGIIVGTVLLYPAGAVFSPPNRPPMTLDWPEMRLLAVAPAARGLGIGATLVRECIRRARRSGSAFLTLHTSDVMRVAMRMYERIGFVRAPELDFHPAQDLTVKGYRLSVDDATV